MRQKQTGKGVKKPPTKKTDVPSSQKKRGVDMMSISDFEDTKVHEGNNYQEQIHTSKKKKKANRITQKKKRANIIASDKPLVQIRQKTSHERALYYLEQLILKHQITKRFPHLAFEKVAHGFDIYYRPNVHVDDEINQNANATQDTESTNIIKFITLLSNLLPIRDLQNKSVMTGAFQKGRLGGGVQGTSLSMESNNDSDKYYIEIAPIYTGDLVCLPQRLYNSSGQIGPLVICYKVTNSLYFIDPYTLKTLEVSAQTYFQAPFRPLLTSTQLLEYTINDVEMKRNHKGRVVSAQSGRFQLGEVTAVKTSELGISHDIQTFCHLSHLLEAGDIVYGYDLKNSNLNNEDLLSYKKLVLPDVIIVRKKYDWDTQRIWTLKHFCMEPEGKDYETFLNELEEDQDLRSKVLLFKHENSDSLASKIKFDGEGKNPRVKLEELLEAWTI
ncbi:hypothetical protein C9374_008603 [Naegleria lovaniensis]|uniref:60S ribosomal export protein NMD3 n=1 Tax=Naegleria lovaniensis TaxID=51637 RepID=A0AA88KHA3_NAELO|nr:uncharacterized protein C9374_008603 [Naegleria lovaniensis]KAG2377981.1 hypothetical protein C9374_008603 [Naegleria lovaniensis]